MNNNNLNYINLVYEKGYKFYKLFGKRTCILGILSLLSGPIVPMFYIFIVSKYTEKIRLSFISSEFLNDGFIKSIIEFIICFAIMNTLHLFNFCSISSFLSSMYYKLMDIMFTNIYKRDKDDINSDTISNSIKIIRNILLIIRLFLIFWISVIFDILLINFYVYIHSKQIGLILLLLYLSNGVLLYILSIVNIRRQRLLDKNEEIYDIFLRDVLTKSESNNLYNLYNQHLKISRSITQKSSYLYGKILNIQLIYEIFIAIYNAICMSIVLYLTVKNTNISSLNKSAIFAMLFSNLSDLWRLTKNIVTFIDTWNSIKIDILKIKEQTTTKIQPKNNIEIKYNSNLYSFNSGLNIISGNSGSGKSMLIREIIKKYSDTIAMYQTDYIYNSTIRYNILLSEEYNEDIFNQVIDLFKNKKLTKLLDLNIKNNLSEGETKIICFIRVIYHILMAEKRKKPYSVIILDEPFNYIDKNNIRTIISYIESKLINQYILIVVDHGNYLNDKANKIYYM